MFNQDNKSLKSGSHTHSYEQNKATHGIHHLPVSKVHLVRPHLVYGYHFQVVFVPADLSGQVYAGVAACRPPCLYPLQVVCGDHGQFARSASDSIIILAESFESWVLEREVEGKEITPRLNRLLKEPHVLYAPNMQTQVRGGRSIDAQLMLNTGLLPLTFGVYSARFPHNVYPSLEKAIRQKYPLGKASCFTVDKKVVWNQAVVAQSFGFDLLLDKPYWVLDEKTGPMHKLGDASFLRQCAGKMASEQIVPTDGHSLVQCVTYSGHHPFVLPDELRRIGFSDHLPKMLNDYLTVANYTDDAIGAFINLLRSQEKFAKTMIVITGDHEGLAESRSHLCNSDAGKGLVATDKFTPFIVINSPVELRYEAVMGQIDMYPTLLNLLGLDDYFWTGMGQSILDPDKKKFAISSSQEVIGNTEGVSAQEIEFAKKAWEVSDRMIACDYFAR